MENELATQWHLRPEPFEGESFSHFLGRYCAVNYISPNILAEHIEVGSAAVGRWRKLRYSPPPSERHLQRLAEVTGVSPERLLAMLPQEPMQIGTIRLCAACFGEVPHHQMHWQYKSTQFCQKHYLTLLSRCPVCKAPFPIPAEWTSGICPRCGTAFTDMSKFQKTITALR
ncbi:MAG: TniQ family protein [Leptolyngbyaceae cyanobacterium]